MAATDVIRRRGVTRTISRPGTATYTDGYAVPAAASTRQIFAHDQPLSGEELRQLPPGENSADYRRVWSIEEIDPLDRINLDGTYYRIVRVEPWQDHWQATVVKVRDTL